MEGRGFRVLLSGASRLFFCSLIFATRFKEIVHQAGRIYSRLLSVEEVQDQIDFSTSPLLLSPIEVDRDQPLSPSPARVQAFLSHVTIFFCKIVRWTARSRCSLPTNLLLPGESR